MSTEADRAVGEAWGILSAAFTRPSMSIQMVDSATAELWLGHNTRNRNLRKSRVDAYARDMASGNWTLTGAPIQFGADGRLLDGQNRLHAIVQSGATVPMFVVRGLEDGAQQYMDIGAKRTVADAVGLAGGSQSKDVAAVARALLMFHTRRVPTHGEMLSYIKENHDQIEFSTEVAKRLQGKLGGTVGVYGIAHSLFVEVDEAATEIFFDRLASGAELNKGNPILVLHRRILTEGMLASRQPVTIRREVAIFIKAWNAWRRGQQVTLFRLGATEKFPEPR